MLRDEILICPSEENILRVLEQGKDGSILYSCLSKQALQVRLYEPLLNKDTLIYMHEGAGDIVNASLNPNKNVIAFTLFEPHKKTTPTSEASHNEKSTPNDDQKNLNEPHPNWMYNPDQSHVPTRRNPDHRCGNDPVKGRYASYIANAHPTTWIRKFNIVRHHFQRVVFTACNVHRSMYGISMTENRVLLIMHRKTIGLYAIVLKPSNGKEIEKSGESEVMEIHAVEQAIKIVHKAFWSQWDPSLQRLFYLVVSKRECTNETGKDVQYRLHTSLCCDQFNDQQSHQQMFVQPLFLDIDWSILKGRSSAYLLMDMNPTVSSPELNMRLIHLSDGTMCLCWQNLSNQNRENLYKILIFNKDLLLQCTLGKHFEAPTRASFTSFDRNVIVHSPGSLIHVLAMDTFSSCSTDFHYHCHYISKGSVFLNRYRFTQLPFSEWNSTGSNHCLVYDYCSNSIVSVGLYRSYISKEFYDDKTSLDNQIALSRFLCHLDKEDDSSFPHLRDVLLKFLDRSMILKGEKILGSYLVFRVARDVSNNFPNAKSLHDLLPVSIPMKYSRSPEFMFHLSEYNLKRHDSNEAMSLYGSSISQDLGPSVCLERYGLNSINEEMKVLKSFDQDYLQSSKTRLVARLSDIYEEIFQSAHEGDVEEDENILDCFSSHEADQTCDYILALHYEKLIDHFKQFFPKEDLILIKSYARCYVITMLQVVNHIIALFLLVTKTDNYDQPLHHPVQAEERNLLDLLNQLHTACICNNFPLPRGFQTFLACLTFRCCLTTHLVRQSPDDANIDFSDSSSENSLKGVQPLLSHASEDIKEFAFEFFQLVDTSCIQLTGEFIARMLEELPNHELYGSLIHQVLVRIKFDTPQSSEGVLQMWKHPHSKSLLAKIQLDRLETIIKTGKKKGRNGGNTLNKAETTNFLPLDVFLEDIQSRASKFNVDVQYVKAATMQHTSRRYGKENLQHIAF